MDPEADGAEANGAEQRIEHSRGNPGPFPGGFFSLERSRRAAWEVLGVNPGQAESARLGFYQQNGFCFPAGWEMGIE